jgi:peroxiredoxin
LAMAEEMNSNNVGSSSETANYPGFGLAIACFVLGIVSIPFSLFLVGGIYGLLGLILGAVHISKKNNLLRPLALWGLVLSLIGLLGSAGFGAYYFMQIRQMQKTMAMIESQDQSYDEWLGTQAPDFSITDLDGDSITLSKLKGKRVVVDFWATWCHPCLMEIPHFIKLRNRYDANDLMIIGLSSEKESTIRSFGKKHRINYALAVEPNLVAPYADITSIPTTFFIDREGVIRYVTEGYHDFENLNTYIMLLDHKHDANEETQDLSGDREP